MSMMLTEIRLTAATMNLEDVGSGSPVVLIHGFPSTRHLWSLVAPGLVTMCFRLLMPDLVGYGSADAPPGISTDMGSQARWILEMLDILRLERVALVAHDVGSAVAQIIAATAPHRVRGIAVLDGVHGRNWAIESIASIQAWDLKEAHRILPIMSRWIATNQAIRHMFRAYEGREGGIRLIRAARDLDPRQTAQLGEALRTSAIPILVIWGERDTIFPVDTVARPQAEFLRAKLVLVPGGHFTPLDCSREVVQALNAFHPGLPP